MKVELAYGRAGLVAEVPDTATVISPRHLPGLADERAAFTAAVREPIGTRPLRDLVRPDQQVVIVISDMTRPTPNERLVPWILAELDHVPRSRFLILNGTGTHRPNTAAELEQMLGAEVVRTVRVKNHSAYAEGDLRDLGTSDRGHRVWLNRHYLDTDARIVVGFIEPHFFAGFSGGPKGVCPGVAGLDTIMTLHGADLIKHPRATWGVLDGNPVHEGVCAAVRLAPPAFMINVTLNGQRDITGVYAGDVFAAHRAGCHACAEAASQAVDGLFDVVVTTNSGFPLDQNLYQTVKGMSAAARIVRPGGTIVVASECSDGLPDHGRYSEILRMRESVVDLVSLIESPDFHMLDQWQAQIQAMVQRKADVYLYSSLPAPVVRQAKLTPVSSVEAGVAAAMQRHGADARVAVLPMGPLTVPFAPEHAAPGP